MLLPLIDLSFLPDLAQLTGAHLTGLFGSHPSAQYPGSDDSIVVLATFLYEAGGSG